VKGIPPGWVTPPERLILLAMAGYADDGDTDPTCFASQKNLALACGWKKPEKMRRHWDSLIGGHWLKEVGGQNKNGATGEYTTKTWRLNVPTHGQWESGNFEVRPTATALRLRSRGYQIPDPTVGLRPEPDSGVVPVTPRWVQPSPQRGAANKREPKNERGSSIQDPKTDPSPVPLNPYECDHLPIDEDGYCSACKTEPGVA